MNQITMNENDFATLAICAIRYCHGRQTYMPGLVQGIVREHLQELENRDLYVMLKDCNRMTEFDFGSPTIDKPGWLKWKEDLENEQLRRKNQTGD